MESRTAAFVSDDYFFPEGRAGSKHTMRRAKILAEAQDALNLVWVSKVHGNAGRGGRVNTAVNGNELVVG